MSDLRLETTAEKRAEWANQADWLLSETMEGPYSVIMVLLRDFDRLLAENASLTAALRDTQDRWNDTSRELGDANIDVARLTAALKRAQIIDSEGRIVDPVDWLTAREAKAREEEREANADLWPCAPTMIGVTKEWEEGFVAGLKAFRAALLARGQQP